MSIHSDVRAARRRGSRPSLASVPVRAASPHPGGRLRPKARRGPCAGGPKGSRARHAYACAAGNRASWPGADCSAGRSACSPKAPDVSSGQREGTKCDQPSWHQRHRPPPYAHAMRGHATAAAVKPHHGTASRSQGSNQRPAGGPPIGTGPRQAQGRPPDQANRHTRSHLPSYTERTRSSTLRGARHGEVRRSSTERPTGPSCPQSEGQQAMVFPARSAASPTRRNASRFVRRNAGLAGLDTAGLDGRGRTGATSTVCGQPCGPA